MNILNGLVGTGVKDAGEGVKAALSGAGGFLKDVRTAITGKDPDLEAKLAEAQGQIDAAQNAINLAEASSSSLFVAGWRPAVGWICALALLWYYILGPVAIFALGIFGLDKTMPAFDLGELIALLVSMLGMSGMRSYEKKSGVER